MAHITFNPALLSTLKDKVVVLTGGATGIGRETVKILHRAGAKILFGDLNTALGESLASSLSSETTKFQHCDTTSYASQLSLFKRAHSLFGKIDIVVANAGVCITKDPFAADADVEEEFEMREIDVSLRGVLFTARIGAWFLRESEGKDGENGGGDLVLVSSIAGFKESTGLGVYTASKHGVLGVLRGTRVQMGREGVRVNGVCPWMTKTAMVAGIERGWRELNLHENTPEDVAKAIIICCTANRGSDIFESGEKVVHEGAKLPFQGRILFVGGGESWEIEEKMDSLESVWLDEENSRVLKIGQEYLMNGVTSWDAGAGSDTGKL